VTDSLLRFGIAGPGTVAHLHRSAIQQAYGAELVAVYGRGGTQTRAFAEQYDIKAYTDLDGFLSSGDIDAIAIATPSGAHRDIGISAAEKGKHILCEKPLEINSERSEEIILSCRKNEVRLGVFFQARFDECTQLAKKAIADDRLGNILLASCQMRWYRTQEYYDFADWRGTWKLDGGGCLMNQGIHTIDLLVHLVGDPAVVSAFQGPHTHDRIEVEDNLCASVVFKSGAIGTIEASTSCSPGFPRRVEISGEKGSISIEDNRIVRWEFDEEIEGDEEIVDRFAAGKQGAGGASDPTAIDVTGHRMIVEDFVKCVQENHEPYIDGIEGKRAVNFICAIYESIRSGALVNLV